MSVVCTLNTYQTHIVIFFNSATSACNQAYWHDIIVDRSTRRKQDKPKETVCSIITGNELFVKQICARWSLLWDALELSPVKMLALSYFVLASHGPTMGTKTLSSLKQQKHPWLELLAPLEQLVQIPWKLPSGAGQEIEAARLFQTRQLNDVSSNYCQSHQTWAFFPSLAVTVIKYREQRCQNLLNPRSGLFSSQDNAACSKQRNFVNYEAAAVTLYKYHS